MFWISYNDSRPGRNFSKPGAGPPTNRKGKKMHHAGLQQDLGWLARVDTQEGGEKFQGFFLLGQLISLVKFQEIYSAYPLNAPAALRHAAPHFELGHNLYVYVLLINLASFSTPPPPPRRPLARPPSVTGAT